MQSSGIQLRISDLLFAVQKRWKIILSLTFIGGVLGLLLTAMTYMQSTNSSYSIKGSFVITTKNSSDQYLYGNEAPSQNDFNTAMDMAEPVLYILRSERVINSVINKQELLGVSYEDIRNNLSTSIYNATMIIEMNLNWVSDEEGILLWNALISETNEVLPKTLQFGRLEVLNECVATAVGAGGGMGKTMPIVLAVLGFAAGLGFALMELLMHPTLTNVKDMETTFGLETIGLIPRDDKFFRKHGSILVQNEPSAYGVQQNYSAAAYILRNRLGTREKPQIFYVTSAINQEGRSTVAANLAIQLSDLEHRTLLVDLDVNNPSLGALFMNNVDYEHSLNALYRGEINEQEAVTTLTGYLDLLPMVLEHHGVPMDGMVMDLIKRLSANYEYVIIDAPPVGKESETLSLNQIASTALFVVGYDKASIPEIQGALEKLDKSGIRVLGCVINGVQGTRYRSTEVKEQKKAGKKKKNETAAETGKTAEYKDLLVKNADQAEKKEEDKSAVNPGKPTRNPLAELEREKKEGKDSNAVQDTLSELYRIGLEGGKETSGKPAEADDQAEKGNTDQKD